MSKSSIVPSRPSFVTLPECCPSTFRTSPMLLFFAFIVAMFITMVLIPPLMKSAERYAFVDMPEERKIHQRPVPRIGGVAMVAGAVTPILLWAEPNREVLALLYGIAVILIFG